MSDWKRLGPDIKQMLREEDARLQSGLEVFPLTRPGFFIDQTWAGTERAGGERSDSYPRRVKRCYELAGYAVCIGDLGEGVLVHGSISGRIGIRYGHAWVLFAPDAALDQVWEPITGRIYDKDEWYAWVDAEEERTYDGLQARRKTATIGHWGRWHESVHL